MNEFIGWFNQVLTISIQLYFQQECEYSSLEEVKPPVNGWLEKVTGVPDLTFDERMVVMLALMPHVCPQILDIFLYKTRTSTGNIRNSVVGKACHMEVFCQLVRLPLYPCRRRYGKRKGVIRFFQKDHWFYTKNILRLEGAGEGEPFLSGQLRVSEEFLSRVLLDKEYKPDYNIGFPAKRITTQLEWEDMVLDYQVATELEEINVWISSGKTVMEDWGLSRILKAGYRSLFYGPPGTGKTLAATLLGKKNEIDVYRIDLSMIVSKYIGETEKNLAKVFDLAENRNWILFFDEADALFGKRTSTNTSNDRHANQEVAYLLQRIEDFPGMVILATNLRSNIDEAFSRRFQSVVYFPMPTEEQRAELWRNMLPGEWLGKDAEELITMAAETELSGGAITNVVRRCALRMIQSKKKLLDKVMLKEALQKEKIKS